LPAGMSPTTFLVTAILPGAGAAVFVSETAETLFSVMVKDTSDAAVVDPTEKEGLPCQRSAAGSWAESRDSVSVTLVPLGKATPATPCSTGTFIV